MIHLQPTNLQKTVEDSDTNEAIHSYSATQSVEIDQEILLKTDIPQAVVRSRSSSLYKGIYHAEDIISYANGNDHTIPSLYIIMY